MENKIPGRDARVALVEIDNDNLRAYLYLKVRPDQENLVAPNPVSIAQAYFNPQAWFCGIKADETPVGFAMLEDWTLQPEKKPADWDPLAIGLWRFMIDARYQALGFGRQALRLLIGHARARVPGGTFYTSYVPADNGPGPFYRGLGFEETGELDGDERVLKLKL